MELSWVSLEDVGNDLRCLPLTVKSVTLSHILIYLTPALISNYISCSVWDKITYSVPNFTGCTVEVWESISNFIHTLQSMWILIHVEIQVNTHSKMGPGWFAPQKLFKKNASYGLYVWKHSYICTDFACRLLRPRTSYDNKLYKYL